METVIKMVEDLDELIQDLENKYISTFSNSSIQPKKFQSSKLSLDINEILSLDVEDKSEPIKKFVKINTNKKIKCCPLFIGGSNVSTGCSSLVLPKACSELHCHNCDFKVSQFKNYEWMGNVSYLFLRTNMPNLDKISLKLRKKSGSVAYACHCVSYSIEKLNPFPVPQSLPWFCRGHIG